MTTSLAPLAPSVDAALAALEPPRAIYSRFGYDDALEAELVKRLTTPPAEGATQDDVAKDMLHLLRSYFPDGSAHIMRYVLKILGHDDLVKQGELF